MVSISLSSPKYWVKNEILYFYGFELLIKTVFVKSSNVRLAYFCYFIYLGFFGIFINYISYQLPHLFLFAMLSSIDIITISLLNRWRNLSQVVSLLISIPNVYPSSIIFILLDDISILPSFLVFIISTNDLHHLFDNLAAFLLFILGLYILPLSFSIFQAEQDDFSHIMEVQYIYISSWPPSNPLSHCISRISILKYIYLLQINYLI